MKMFKEHFEMD